MLPKAIETYLTKIIAFKIWEIPSQVSIEMPFWELEQNDSSKNDLWRGPMANFLTILE